MSHFYEVEESYLQNAIPLKVSGATCCAYCITENGKRFFMKCLKPEFEGQPRYVAAFTKEFVTGKSLSHPNLVRYHRMSTSSTSTYMILDYVAGETLAERLKSNPQYFMQSDNLYRFVSQLLSCLGYLHSNQIVHLDIKPDNIMLTQVDSDVKLLDLGFCYTDAFVSTMGRTDAFAAPEQREGGSMDVDARTDLYSVGRILQEIERAVGSRLPRPYGKLMHWCLMTEKDKRPHHASDCLRLLNRPKKMRYSLAALCVVILTFVLGLVCSDLAADYREANKLYAPNGKLYDFIFEDIYYRITSEDSLTCEAVGWARNRPADVRTNSIMILSRVVYDEKEYNVVSVADSAFYGCKDARSIYVAEGVKKIGVSSFSRCRNVPVISLPSTIHTIGRDAFSIISMQYVQIPDSLTKLPENCFSACKNLSSVNVPEGVERIGLDCFAIDSTLVEVRLPSTLKYIDRGVFYYCKSLRQITIPANVTTIGEYTFYKCNSLTDVYDLSPRPQKITTIFDNKNVRVHIPKGSMPFYKSDPAWNKMQLMEM